MINKGVKKCIRRYLLMFVACIVLASESVKFLFSGNIEVIYFGVVLGIISLGLTIYSIVTINKK